LAKPLPVLTLLGVENAGKGVEEGTLRRFELNSLCCWAIVSFLSSRRRARTTSGVTFSFRRISFWIEFLRLLEIPSSVGVKFDDVNDEFEVRFDKDRKTSFSAKSLQFLAAKSESSALTASFSLLVVSICMANCPFTFSSCSLNRLDEASMSFCREFVDIRSA